MMELRAMTSLEPMVHRGVWAAAVVAVACSAHPASSVADPAPACVQDAVPCGLYENPVIDSDCPDPGVLFEDGLYVLTCTSGDAPAAYPIRTSSDLVTWTSHGHVFPEGHRPTWAVGDFWAPEIHKVGDHYVAYFSARDRNGRLSIGAASATNLLGPFADLGHPLVEDSSLGLIDASEINASDGTPYLLWKVDGNAVGQPTPIHAQALATDGLARVGPIVTLITNDLDWEGAVTEAPFMIERGGSYFLFYSGGSYADATYAVGVARASSPLGPFTKASAPLIATRGAWVGPGHCAVVETLPSQGPSETYMVYHAWKSGCVNADGCGRVVLVDAIDWSAAWPKVPHAPSSSPRPLPP
jgi:arabinan endo-1,5-alpha-L-arabinosidase